MSERSKKRRRWTAEEKLRIVLTGMESVVEISELCRREGINPTQYYGWKKTLLSSAGRVFHGRSERTSRKEERLQAEVARFQEVIAEITAENLELKKRSRTRGLQPDAAGTSTTSSCRSGADAPSQRLERAANAFRPGRPAQQLLPLVA